MKIGDELVEEVAKKLCCPVRTACKREKTRCIAIEVYGNTAENLIRNITPIITKANLATELEAEALKKDTDFTYVVKWVTAFLQNSSSDFEATDHIEMMDKACAAKLNPWETACAIAEGHSPFDWCEKMEKYT